MRNLFYSILAAGALLAFASCGLINNEQPGNNSIVASWSLLRPDSDLKPENAFIHLKFTKDGKFTQVMYAWWERRDGTYTIDGDVITFQVTSLAFLGPTVRRPGTLQDLYSTDPHDPEPTFEKWVRLHPDEAKWSTKFSIDSEGALSFEKPILGLEGKYVRHDDYVIPSGTQPE